MAKRKGNREARQAEEGSGGNHGVGTRLQGDPGRTSPLTFRRLTRDGDVHSPPSLLMSCTTFPPGDLRSDRGGTSASPSVRSR